MLTSLTPQLASHLASIALGHVTREYPNKLDHVMCGPEDVRSPRELHPIFYGSYDWHSCVHTYWLLARLLRLFPSMPDAQDIRTLLTVHFTEDKVAGELNYLHRPASRGFERPYGWAWLLMLSAELSRHADPATRQCGASLAPLAQAFAERFQQFLPRLTYPIRTGTHYNTAFALALAHEYAASAGDKSLNELIETSALLWFGNDRACQAWEPCGDDFLSPALTEAQCMRCVLAPEEFRSWFALFLPHLGQGEPAALFEPAIVSDRSDGKIAHLDGLNLSRAWCWRSIARGLRADEPLKARALATAGRHLESALPHLSGDYMGEHWLATFALLALTA
jgi:Protein of unknown function (DUF2891)